MTLTRSIALLACLMPVAAVAIPVQSSVGTFVTARNCIPGPNGPCEFLSSIQFSQYDGAPGGLVGDAVIDIPGFGTAESTIALSGTVGAPAITTSAHSVTGARTNTNSFALQRYVYDGAVASTRTFGGNLTYTQSIVDPNNALYEAVRSASGIFAHIVLFTSTDTFAEAGDTAQTNYDNLLAFANGGAAGYSLLGEDTFVDLTDVTAATTDLGVTIGLNPGDAFWVFTFLQTPAGNGSFVETFSPFMPEWDDTSGLTPANVASVPEPGSMSLAMLGLCAALVSLRKRRTRSPV